MSGTRAPLWYRCVDARPPLCRAVILHGGYHRSRYSTSYHTNFHNPKGEQLRLSDINIVIVFVGFFLAKRRFTAIAATMASYHCSHQFSSFLILQPSQEEFNSFCMFVHRSLSAEFWLTFAIFPENQPATVVSRSAGLPCHRYLTVPNIRGQTVFDTGRTHFLSLLMARPAPDLWFAQCLRLCRGAKENQERSLPKIRWLGTGRPNQRCPLAV